MKREDGSWAQRVVQRGIQGGARAVKNVLALIDGKVAVPFRYLNKGELATIGRNRGVAALGGFAFQRGVRLITAAEKVEPPVIGKLQEAKYSRN